MEQRFDSGWQFSKQAPGSSREHAADFAFHAVDIPHDWLIWQHEDLYEDSDGWYRNQLPACPEGTVCELDFDGVYMDWEMWINDVLVCAHHYGYTSVVVDVTRYLTRDVNTLLIQVKARHPNSRWYAGAGIFRPVRLRWLPKHHIVTNGIYVTTTSCEGGWQVDIATQLAGEGGDAVLTQRILDAQGNQVALHRHPAKGAEVHQRLFVPQPALWSCGQPNLYLLETTLGEQVVVQNIGFRTFTVTPDHGLFLNGQAMKIKGVCLHHDLGALGAAFHEKAARRQLQVMKNMGVNALRTAHNPPAREVMDMCDEMGLIVMDESFDMWGSTKTACDYGRFFMQDFAEDVRLWVTRDRNHPSLFMWSIGNEIHDTHANPDAINVLRALKAEVRRYDPAGNGLISMASNLMLGQGAQRCAHELDAVGYNYGEKLYRKQHEANPHWAVYGSETAAMVSSRGVYHFPKHVNILSDIDMQCSDLGNSAVSFGSRTLEECVSGDLGWEYSLGQFLWSGIDYIGEPTPYQSRSSFFGQADTACYPKEGWHLFRAAWQCEDVVHISVTWDWNAGQVIDVPVATNAEECELFLNGVSLGRQQVDRLGVHAFRPVWQVCYAPGELRAVAYRGGQCVGTDWRSSYGNSAQICLSCDETQLRADGHDLAFVHITMKDAWGRVVENANDRVHIEVSGAGRLMGTDNGDSTDPEGYKANTRRLFSGKLLAMVGALDHPGSVTVTVTSPGMEKTELTLPVVAAQGKVWSCVDRIPAAPLTEDCPVRRLDMKVLGLVDLNPQQPNTCFEVTLLPETAAAQPIIWTATNAAGIEAPCVALTPCGNRVHVQALGNGVVYVRASCCNGAPHSRVLSQMEIRITGMGTTRLNPYGFISAGLYDVVQGEISPGNEHGAAFAPKERSLVGFTNVDMGPDGSDEITLPVFALDGSQLYQIGLWEGIPGQGGVKIADLPYCKPVIRWNTYQSETYRLPRKLKGVVTLCFELHDKIHLKGFSFTRQSRCWELHEAAGADAIYGDSYRVEGSRVLDIGNNVSLLFEGMDFADRQHVRLALTGTTPLEQTTVMVRIADAQGEEKITPCDFDGHGGETQLFDVEVPSGLCRVTFLFLPGARFDFTSFRFT